MLTSSGFTYNGNSPGFPQLEEIEGVTHNLAEATNVLIVEDEAIIALDVAGDLAKWGYGISGIATTLEHAVALARKSRPALAIVDVSLLGNETGFSIARALTTEFDVAIIFLTAHSDSRTRAQIMEARPVGYLFKPYSGIALRNLLEMVALQ